MPKDWNTLNKPEREKLLKSAGLPAILSQLRWGNLTKTQRSKIEKSSKKGKGWHEQKEDVVTEKGTEQKAPVHRKVALQKAGQEAINEPIEVEEPEEQKEAPEFKKGDKESLKERLTGQGADLKRVNIDQIEDYIHPRTKAIVKRYKLRLTNGIFSGKTTYRCPECYRALEIWVAGESAEHLHLACEMGHATTFDKAIDLRKIGKDKGTTKWAKEEYKTRLEEAKEQGFDTIISYYNSGKSLGGEYTKLGVGLEKTFNPDASKKEPPLITDPLRKSYDPTFEQSEDERMKEEASQEPEEDTVDYYDTGKLTKYDLDDLRYSPYPEGMQSPEEEEFSDLFAEAVFTGAINTEPSPNKLLNPESIRSRWQSFFYKDPEGTIKELKDLIKKQKPKGKEEITVSFDSLIATPKLKKDLKKLTDEELVALHKKVKYSSHHDAIDQELTSRGYFKKREQQELRAKYASIPKEKLEGLLNFYKNDKDKDSFINEIEVIREILKK